MSERTSAIIGSLSSDRYYLLSMHAISKEGVSAWQDFRLLMHALYYLCEDEEKGIARDKFRNLDPNEIKEIIDNAKDEEKEAIIDVVNKLQNINNIMERLKINNLNPVLLDSTLSIEDLFAQILSITDSINGRRFNTLTTERSFQVTSVAKSPQNNILKTLLNNPQE